MRAFNNNIKRIIEKFSYDFFVIQQDFNIDCSCKNFTTKQADPTCPKCLGTGHKIKVKKIRGASEDRKATFRNSGLDEQTLAYHYYIDAKYPISEQNIIVDGDEVMIAYRIEKKKTANREHVYTKVAAHKKKSDIKIFMKNFSKIVGDLS
jgi:hypothetical protein